MPPFTRSTFYKLSNFKRLFSSLTENSSVVPVSVEQNYRLDIWTAAHDAQQRSWFSPASEKITVNYIGKIGEPSELQMSKGLSTPIDCAAHLSSLLADRSALALVDGLPWSMHRPFIQNCTLDFLHFKDSHHDPTPANIAFWRSASFLLAATLESAFQSVHNVQLISNPSLKPESGGFLCDVAFSPSKNSPLEPWIPSAEELRALSAHGQRLATANLKFEPLEPTPKLLSACFSDRPVRLKQIERELRAESSPSKEVSSTWVGAVYRMGSFVEVSAGVPLISSTRLIGRFAVSSFRPIGWLRNHSPDTGQPIIVYRVQGVALPTAFITHFTTFDRLIQWSKEANTAAEKSPDYVTPF